MTRLRLCSTTELSPGQAKAFVVTEEGQSLTIALVRDEAGEWHAIDDMCPHADVSLSEGDVEGCTIECWGHGAKVDLKTGEGTLPITTRVNVYPVIIDGDDVYVDAVFAQ